MQGDGAPSLSLYGSPKFRSAFGSVTQASDPVMGRFDLGKLTGNKLLR
jgi:hypothetical protein